MEGVSVAPVASTVPQAMGMMAWAQPTQTVSTPAYLPPLPMMTRPLGTVASGSPVVQTSTRACQAPERRLLVVSHQLVLLLILYYYILGTAHAYSLVHASLGVGLTMLCD
jgi:hypothetical protein